MNADKNPADSGGTIRRYSAEMGLPRLHRNGETSSSLTGRTSGLPKTELSNVDRSQWFPLLRHGGASKLFTLDGARWPDRRPRPVARERSRPAGRWLRIPARPRRMSQGPWRELRKGAWPTGAPPRFRRWRRPRYRPPRAAAHALRSSERSRDAARPTPFVRRFRAPAR